MPCLVALLALFAPRLALFLLWLFSDFLQRAYEGWFWPLLGFLFMPLTTLGYAAAINWNGQVTGWYFVLVLMAALADLGVLGGGGRRYQRMVITR